MFFIQSGYFYRRVIQILFSIFMALLRINSGLHYEGPLRHQQQVVMGRPYLALEVGCTGKALFSVSSRLHWAIGLGLGTVSTLLLGQEMLKSKAIKQLGRWVSWQGYGLTCVESWLEQLNFSSEHFLENNLSFMP